MYQVTLDWKSFNVGLDKVNVHLKSLLSSNYDGLLCDSENIKVVFFDSPSQADQDLMTVYWAGIQASDFTPTSQEIVSKIIDNAQIFGQSILSEFATENVLMGITQAGKTIAVTNYLHKLSHYVMTGSLYAALTEINSIIADTTKGDLAPFITDARMNVYKAKIAAYLGM